MDNQTKKKRTMGILVRVLLLAVFLGLLAGIFVFSELFIKEDKEGKTVVVEIPAGSGVKKIGKILKENEVINSELAFYAKVKQLKADTQLKYGTFELNDGYCLDTIIDKLINEGAMKEATWFTVPEGYTIERIGTKLEEEGLCAKKDFLKAVQEDYDYWFLESIPEKADVTYRLEGFLFPETYDLGDDITAEGIVRTMLDHFESVYTKEMDQKAKDMGKTTFEIITAASLIERETDQPDERRTIAGVIENRLEEGMRLQIDPTFLYPITKGMYDKAEATYEDTRVDSPYNTYVNYGLPVGPICNPGLPCIEAALDPEEHEYLFYHTDTKKNDGSHIFTKTYEEHLETQK